MDLRQLRQFVAVAENLSFRRAAQVLHIAQPPLSVSIRKLEAEWGVTLFARRGRRIEITSAGLAALPIARRSLEVAQSAAQAARDAEHGETGRLRLGFVGSATYDFLPRLLTEFRTRYPRVEIELKDAINVEILPDVEAERLDVGIVRVPTHEPRDLEFEVCERDVFRIALKADHPYAARRSIALRTMSREPFIGYGLAKVPGMQALAMAAFQSAGVVPRVTQEAFQVQTILSLVKSGMGFALVPGVCACNLPPGVVLRPISGLPKEARLGLAIVSRVGSANPAVSRLREVAGLVRR